MKISLACIAIATALGGCASPGTSQPLGTRPAYLEAVAASVPNDQAFGRRIWVPGLEDGFVPQGLTVEGAHVYVSSYRSADPKVNTGPCRIFRLEMASGKLTGQFDMPPTACTHAGGLAALPGGRLFLADTRQVFMIDAAKAFAAGTAEGAMKAVKITGELRGSFAAADGKDFWIGTWTREQPKARMFRLHPELFEKHDGQTVKEDLAVESIPVPVEAQGAAFDAHGNLWVSVSNSKMGMLHKLDRKGTVLTSYPMVIGLEDLGFDASGRLWAVSESGTRKYLHWGLNYPFVFEIDVAKLR